MKSKYNFNANQWITIAICFLLAMLCNAITSDSENVILPMLAKENGWDYYGKVLTIVSAAGVLSVIGNFVLGKLCETKGAKFVIIFSLIAGAFFVFLYGTSANYIVLLIGLIGTISCGQSLFYLGVNAIVSNWFSDNKGIAMGFISVGPPVATVVMVSLLTFVIRALGTRGGIFVICGVLLLVALLCVFLIHDAPKDMGASALKEETDTGVSTRKILRTPALWFIILSIGICSMAQTGLMAQWIVRYNGTKFSSQAGWMMSLCAVVGIFGSMIAGSIENKLGIKRGYAFLAIWFVIALVFNFTNLPVLVYISIPMFGLIITMFQIFMPLFVNAVFGREGFKQANAIVFPLTGLMGQLTFLVIALCKNAFGDVRYAYLIYATLIIISIFFVIALPNEDKEQSAHP